MTKVFGKRGIIAILFSLLAASFFAFLVFFVLGCGGGGYRSITLTPSGNAASFVVDNSGDITMNLRGDASSLDRKFEVSTVLNGAKTNDIWLNIQNDEVLNLIGQRIVGDNKIFELEVCGPGASNLDFHSNENVSRSINVKVNVSVVNLSIDKEYRPYIVRGSLVPLEFDLSRIFFNQGVNSQGIDNLKASEETKAVSFRSVGSNILAGSSFDGNKITLASNPLSVNADIMVVSITHTATGLAIPAEIPIINTPTTTVQGVDGGAIVQQTASAKYNVTLFSNNALEQRGINVDLRAVLRQFQHRYSEIAFEYEYQGHQNVFDISLNTQTQTSVNVTAVTAGQLIDSTKNALLNVSAMTDRQGSGTVKVYALVDGGAGSKVEGKLERTRQLVLELNVESLIRPASYDVMTGALPGVVGTTAVIVFQNNPTMFTAAIEPSMEVRALSGSSGFKFILDLTHISPALFGRLEFSNLDINGNVLATAPTIVGQRVQVDARFGINLKSGTLSSQIPNEFEFYIFAVETVGGTTFEYDVNKTTVRIEPRIGAESIIFDTAGRQDLTIDNGANKVVATLVIDRANPANINVPIYFTTTPSADEVSAISFRYQDVNMSRILEFGIGNSIDNKYELIISRGLQDPPGVVVLVADVSSLLKPVEIRIEVISLPTAVEQTRLAHNSLPNVPIGQVNGDAVMPDALVLEVGAQMYLRNLVYNQEQGGSAKFTTISATKISIQNRLIVDGVGNWSSPVTITGENDTENNGRISAQFDYNRQGIILTGGLASGTVRVQVWFVDQQGNETNIHTGAVYTTTFDALVTRTPRRQDIAITQNGEGIVDKATIFGRNLSINSPNLTDDVFAISLEGFSPSEIEANNIRFEYNFSSNASAWLNWGANAGLSGLFSGSQPNLIIFAKENPSSITGAVKVDLTFTVRWGNSNDNYLTRTIAIVIEPRAYSSAIEILHSGVYVEGGTNNMYFDARGGFMPVSLSARAFAKDGNLATDPNVIFEVYSGGGVISIENNVLTILQSGKAVISMSGADGGIIPDPRLRFIYIYVANGTATNPYLIFNANELKTAASTVGPNNFFRLANDIDLLNQSWTSRNFLGSLDGDGFTISNLSTRLFNAVSGYIKHITIFHSNITLPVATFGGVVANSITNKLESNNINLRAISLSQLTTTGGTHALNGMNDTDKRLNAFLLISPDLSTGANQWTHASKDFEINTTINGDAISSKGKTNITMGTTGAGSIVHTVINRAYALLNSVINTSELFDIKIYATAAGGSGLLSNEGYDITTNRGEQVTVSGGQVILNNFTFGEVIFTVSHPNIALPVTFSIYLASNTFYQDFTATNASGEIIPRPIEVEIIRTASEQYHNELVAHRTAVMQPFATTIVYTGTTGQYKEVVFIESLGAINGKVFERPVTVKPIEAVKTFFADMGAYVVTPTSPQLVHIVDRMQDIMIVIRYASTIDGDLPTILGIDKNGFVLDGKGNKKFLLRYIEQSITDGELFTFRLSPLETGTCSLVFVPGSTELQGASGNRIEIIFNIIDNSITSVNSFVVDSLIETESDLSALVTNSRNALLPTTNRAKNVVGPANNLVLEVLPRETSIIGNDGTTIDFDPVTVANVQAIGSRPIYTPGISQGTETGYYEPGGEGTLLPTMNLGYRSFLDPDMTSSNPDLRTPAERQAFINARVDDKSTNFWFLPFWFDITSNNVSVSIGQVYEFAVAITWSNGEPAYIYKIRFAVDYALAVMAEHVFATPTPEESEEWLAPFREVIIGNTYEVELTHIENAVNGIPVDIHYSVSAQPAQNGIVSERDLVPGRTLNRADISISGNRLSLNILSINPANFYLRIWITQTIGGVQTPISNVVELSYMPVMYGLRGLHFARPSEVPAQGLPAVTATGSYGNTSGGTFSQPSSINHYMQVRPTVVYSQNADVARQGREAVNELITTLNTQTNLQNLLKYVNRDTGLYEAIMFGIFDSTSDFMSISLMPNDALDLRAKWMDIRYRIGYGSVDYSLDASWFSLNASREWQYNGETAPEDTATRRQTNKFDFSFVIKPGPNEDNPFPIRTAEELRSYLHINGTAQNIVEDMHLVLVNDIEIDASWWNGVYSIETQFASLDGNEHIIILTDRAFNGFEPGSDTTHNIGIFGTVGENTLLKNITIGIKKRVTSDTENVFTMFFDRQIAGSPILNIGLLAGQNNGIITNARIVPVKHKATTSVSDNHLAVGRTHSSELFDLGGGATIKRVSYELDDPLVRAKAIIMPIVSDGAVTINAGALVGLNNGFITNCRVGDTKTVNGKIENHEVDFYVGETGTGSILRDRIIQTLGMYYNQNIDFVNIVGAMGRLNFGGFVGINNKKISSSFIKGADLTANSTAGAVGGFVAYNLGEINYCFVEGSAPPGTLLTAEQRLRLTGRKIKSALITGGFVNTNSGYIGNSYANIKIEDSANNAGFVWHHRKLNESELPVAGILSEAINAIEYSFTLVELPTLNNSQMFAFVGLLSGVPIARIHNSFWLEFDSDRGVSIGVHLSTNDARAGAYVNELDFFEDDQKFSGYAFSEVDGDGAIWKRDISHSIGGIDYMLPRLLPAMHRAVSMRSHIRTDIAVDSSRVDYYSYLDDAQPDRIQSDYYIGTYNNPNLIYDAAGFNKIMEVAEEMQGSGTIAANTGFYRFVKNVDMAGIHSDSHFATIRGQIDGNGMTVSNVHANGGAATINVPDAIGLFGVIESDPAIKMIAGVRGLRVELNEVYAAQIPFVGGLAGRVSNANIFDIQVRPNPNRVSSYVMGQNIVGGALGLVDGTSRVYGINSSIGVFSTFNFAAMTSDFAIGSNLRTRASRFDVRPEYRTAYDALICVDNTLNGSGCNKEDHTHTFVKVYHQMSYAGGAIGALNTTTRQVEDTSAGGTSGSVYTVRPNASSIYVENAWVDGVYSGGVAGYVGENAIVTGLRFTAGADSFINGITVSGGTIGENRGNVMFLIATFEEQVQNKIDAVLGETSERDGLNFGTFTSNKSVFGRASSRAIGGLVGLNYGGLIRHAQSQLPIDNSLSYSSGGIVGTNVGGTIEYAVATASVCAMLGRPAGGIVGTAINYNGVFEGISGAMLPYLLSSPLAIRDSYAINGYNPNAAMFAPQGGTSSSFKGGIVGSAIGGVGTGANVAVSTSASGRNKFNPFFYSSLLLIENEPITSNIYWCGSESTASIANVFESFSSSQMRSILKGEPAGRALVPVHTEMPDFWNYSYTTAISNSVMRFPYIYSFINPYANAEFVSNWSDLANAAKKVNEENMINLQIVLLDDLLAASRPNPQPVFKNFNGSIVGRTGGKAKVEINTALFNSINNAKFENIEFVIAGGTRSATDGDIGMVVNKSSGSRFENVSLTMASTVTVSSSVTASVGGLIGRSSGSDNFLDVDINGFRITTSSSGADFSIGGLVGRGGSVSVVGGSTQNVVINANSVTASARTVNIGGLVGNATGSVNITGTSTKTIQIAGSITADNTASTNWTKTNIGGFVGSAGGVSTISHVKSDVTIKTGNNINAIGGIVGYAANTTINDAQVLKVPTGSAFSGASSVANGYLGVFGGVMNGGARLYATGFTNAPVVDTLTGGVIVGAIAGKLAGGTLSYCFADINVSGGTGSGKVAGGLVGEMSVGSIIERSFSDNKVEGHTIGGLAGQNNGGKISLSYSTSRLLTTAADGTVGGLMGSSTGGEIMSSYFAGRILTNPSNIGLIFGSSGTQATLVSSSVYVLEEIAGAINKNGATELPFWSANPNNAGTLSRTIPGSISANWVRVNHSTTASQHLPRIAGGDDQFMTAQENNKNAKAVFATTTNLADTTSAENNIYIVKEPLTITSQLPTFSGILIGSGNREQTITVSGTTSLFAGLNEALVSNLAVINANLVASMTNSFVSRIYTTGNVTAANGFGGIINTLNSGVLTQSHSDMIINATSRTNVGGLVGAGTATAANAQIVNSFFSGEIYGINGQAGTILGSNNATLHNVYSTGNVLGSVTTNHYKLNDTNTNIKNSFSISFVQEGTNANDFSLYTQSWYSDRVKNTNSNWQASWQVNENNNYFPLLNGFRLEDQRLGSRINPHKISQEIANNSASANSAFTNMRKPEYKDDAFILTNDITFAQGSNNVPQANFYTIGEFTGTLYGNNKTITNMTVTTGQATRVPDGVGNLYGGMFSVLDNAFVSNMTFVNATVVVAQAQNVGIVAGEIKARSVVAGISWDSGVMFAGATQSGNAQDSTTQADTRVRGLVGKVTGSIVGSRIARATASRIYEAGADNNFNRGNTLPAVATSGITTAAQLQAALNSHTAGTVISLSGNITMSGTWAGITDFYGTLEGNGYIISGLTGNPFVRYNRGIIKNVRFENANINSSYGGAGNAGGIVAAENYGQIHNVFAFGAIRYGFSDVGSIVGANHALASNITAFGAVWADKPLPIGIIGGQA